MESSRGGPLSTFIMMLPLIVVPTVAMLKPAGNPVGMVTDMLSASSEGDQSANTAVPPGAFTNADEFSDFFEDEAIGLPPDRATASNASPFAEQISDGSDSDLMDEAISGFDPDFPSDRSSSTDGLPFQDDGGWPLTRQNPEPTAMSQPGADELRGLLTRVEQVGASEVMWFQPGGSSEGFIAFFHNNGNGQILRFEAVAATKVAAVKDVLWQIQQRKR